jgi:hypothetical protein
MFLSRIGDWAEFLGDSILDSMGTYDDAVGTVSFVSSSPLP